MTRPITAFGTMLVPFDLADDYHLLNIKHNFIFAFCQTHKNAQSETINFVPPSLFKLTPVSDWNN